MAFYLNELSLHDQFHDRSDFLQAIKTVLSCREILNTYAFSLHCSRIALKNRPVMGGVQFSNAIGNLANPELRRIIWRWVDQEGPFWDNGQEHSPDEFFYVGPGQEVVTDTALAEASFHAQAQNPGDSYTSVISFAPSVSYNISPIIVFWYRSENQTDEIHLPNHWLEHSLIELLPQLQPPLDSWNQMMERAQAQYGNLIFLPGFMETLNRQPFSSTVANQALRLFSIIHELKNCFDATGTRTSRGHEIINDYFTGVNAKFSDESETNKQRFRRELTFRTPDGKIVFCPYHGKISHQYYRLHFSWPITKDDPLYIAYIGPKITKE